MDLWLALLQCSAFIASADNSSIKWLYVIQGPLWLGLSLRVWKRLGHRGVMTRTHLMGAGWLNKVALTRQWSLLDQTPSITLYIYTQCSIGNISENVSHLWNELLWLSLVMSWSRGIVNADFYTVDYNVPSTKFNRLKPHRESIAEWKSKRVELGDRPTVHPIEFPWTKRLLMWE
jgi:hypothetical protein